MSFLEKLKSLLGVGDGREESVDSPGSTVTVEREPSAASEHAVKGTDEFEGDDAADEVVEPEDADSEPSETASPDTDEPSAEEEAEEPEEEPPTETSAAEPADGDGASVEEISGIGPTYAERLAAAGIETVADLAAADPETVAEAAEAGQSRAEDWIAQGNDR